MINTKFKITLHILIILIFNNFLAQNNPEKVVKNEENKTDSVVIRREEQLNAPLYMKSDNNRNDIEKKTTFLNKNAQVKYQDMQIDADYISIDWSSGVIYARAKLESLGKIKDPAEATQGGKK